MVDEKQQKSVEMKKLYQNALLHRVILCPEMRWMNADQKINDALSSYHKELINLGGWNIVETNEH
jgi:hypothetical protein